MKANLDNVPEGSPPSYKPNPTGKGNSMSKARNGRGTPGEAKGGAWGKTDSKPPMRKLDTSQVGTKPWVKSGRSHGGNP